MAFTNTSRNTTAITNANKTPIIMTWDKATFAWDDASGTWDTQSSSYARLPKDTTAFTNKNKS